MIKAGLNIGNSKISCVVCDYKNFQSIKFLSLINIPSTEIKKNIIVNYSKLFEETKKLLSDSEKNSQTKLHSININIPAIESISEFYNSEIFINDEKISDLHLKKIINQSNYFNKNEDYFESVNNIIAYELDNKLIYSDPIGNYANKIRIFFYRLLLNKKFVNKEVILAAGSFITPKLLMLSGIGNPEELKKFNISSIVDLPGVGENLIDHPECLILAKANGPYGYYKQGVGWRMIKNGLQFKLFGSGPVNSTGVEAGAFINPLDQDGPPSIQAFFIPSLYMNSDTIGVIKEDYGMSITTVVTKPQSRGSVKLNSANPKDRPQISLNLLKEENDLKMMIAGQKFFLKAFQSGPLGKKVKEILIPDVKNLDDEKLAVHCKKFVKTNYHPSGTAKMGADGDKMAVLDAKMRVRGIENLRICDLSAVPNINSGNTSAPAIMLGLRCGDLINNVLKTK